MTITENRVDVGRGKYLVLSVLGCCFLVVMMDNTILNVALQTIQRQLDATNSQLQWAVDAYILVYAALMFSAGVLADAHGRRRVLLAGLAIFTIGSAMSAFASTPNALILWRCVMGFGGAVVPPATLALIKETFPKDEHAKAMGVWAALGGLSVAFGPILGGVLLEHFWWGSVFLINVPIVLVASVLILRAVPDSRAPKASRLDLPGVALSMAGIALVVYGVIRGGETSHWLAPTAAGAIVAGVLLIGLFVAWEQRQSSPALDVSLLRNLAFTGGTLSISFAFFALTGGTFLLVFYIQLIRGHTPLQLGLILLPVAAGSVVSAISSGMLAARFGARVATVGGLAFLLVSFVSLSRLDAHTAMWLIEICLLAAGLGMGLVMGTTTTLVMSVVQDEKSGVGAAVNNTLRQVGAALGVAVMGSVYSQSYRAHLGDVVNPLPPHLRSIAANSLGGTLGVLDRLLHSPAAPLVAPRAAAVTARGRTSFLDAMHVSVLTAAGVLAVALVLALFLLPGNPSTPGSHSEDRNHSDREV